MNVYLEELMEALNLTSAEEIENLITNLEKEEELNEMKPALNIQTLCQDINFDEEIKENSPKKHTSILTPFTNNEKKLPSKETEKSCNIPKATAEENESEIHSMDVDENILDEDILNLLFGEDISNILSIDEIISELENPKGNMMTTEEMYTFIQDFLNENKGEESAFQQNVPEQVC